MHPTLDDLITSNGYGFTEFADLTGLNRQNVHRIRSGRCRTMPQPKTIKRIAEVLFYLSDFVTIGQINKVKRAIAASRRAFLKAPSDCEV